MSDIRIPIHSGIVGHSIQTGQPVIIDNAYDDHRFNRKVDQKTGYRTKAILVIPIQNNEGEIIGAYQAINKMTSSGVFSSADLEHLTLAASYTGKSLETASLILSL